MMKRHVKMQELTASVGRVEVKEANSISGSMSPDMIDITSFSDPLRQFIPGGGGVVRMSFQYQSSSDEIAEIMKADVGTKIMLKLAIDKHVVLEEEVILTERLVEFNNQGTIVSIEGRYGGSAMWSWPAFRDPKYRVEVIRGNGG